MKTVTLHDGRQVANDSEEWRHECEARTLLRWPLAKRKIQLNLIAAKRGRAARQQLERTMMALWIERQAQMLADLNPPARMERLQVLRRDNGGHIIDRIEARMRAIEDSRSGIAANDKNKTERAA
jgi:hypothetical protein